MNVWDHYEDASSSESDDSNASVKIVPLRSRGASRKAAEPRNKTYECTFCDETFGRKADLKKHKDGEEDHHYCLKCDRDFPDEKNLKLHRIKSSFHLVCVDCEREFASSGGLARHREQMHRSARPIPCPGCLRVFTNASGLVQHVENNLCEGGLKRHVLQRKIVEANDALANISISDTTFRPQTTSTHVWRHGVLPFDDADTSGSTKGDDFSRCAVASVGSGVTAASSSKWGGVSFLDYTDTLGVAPTGTNPDAPWTPKDVQELFKPELRMWQCPHSRCHKKYPQVQSLVQHLNSPVHMISRFRCPKCLRRFQSSSGILQHMESNTCGINDTTHAALITQSLTGNLVLPRSSGRG
ncbi:hypothetical protein RUND412_008459 [Rhizina undulata]